MRETFLTDLKNAHWTIAFSSENCVVNMRFLFSEGIWNYYLNQRTNDIYKIKIMDDFNDEKRKE